MTSQKTTLAPGDWMENFTYQAMGRGDWGDLERYLVGNALAWIVVLLAWRLK